MTFVESISTCFKKYADFEGRAARSEYWWWTLFLLLAATATYYIHPMVYLLFGLGSLLPSIAVTARRLHDTDRSGWWQLLYFLPLIGAIIMLVFLVQSGREPNRFIAVAE